MNTEENGIVIFGAGGPQSHLHMHALEKSGICLSSNPDYRVVGCINPDTAMARQFVTDHRLGNACVLKDEMELPEILGKYRGRLVALICTPVKTHIEILRTILLLHKDHKLKLQGVICEKLLGRETQEAEKITKEYEEVDIPLGVVCQKYFSSGILLAQKLLSDVTLLNQTFRTEFAEKDIGVVRTEVHFSKDRRNRSLRAKTNNLHNGNAPWTHFELPHMAAIVDALIGTIGEIKSIDGRDMLANISEVREDWVLDHPGCLQGNNQVIIKNHAGGQVVAQAGDTEVVLCSSLENPLRQREVILTLTNGATLHIHLDPGENHTPESSLELREMGKNPWKTPNEPDNSLGACLKSMLEAIREGSPLPSDAKRHIELLHFLDRADQLLGVN